MKKNTPEATFERLKRTPLDVSRLDYTSIEMEDVNRSDYPDFCDAFISYATFKNGVVLTDEQIEQLNTEHSDIVYECAIENIYY